MARIVLKRDNTLDKFKELYDNDADIIFLWGGRGLGKSDNLARVLCDKCMRPEPFKCILLREIQDTVLESSYEEIKSFIISNGLDRFFTMTKAPIKITFNPNGNSFIGIGGDKPAKLKGIKNPTHLWAEEADTIKTDTLDTAIGSLRQEGVKTQAYFTFNPELRKDGTMPILERYFYPHSKDMSLYYDKSYTWIRDVKITYSDKEVTESIKYLSIHGHCNDNKYCPASTVAFYESFKGVDDNKYNVWRWGRVGVRENERPFFKSKESNNLRYLNTSYTPINDLPILVAFDYNYDPCTAILMQYHNGFLRNLDIPVGLHVYKVIQATGDDQFSSTEKVCNLLIDEGVRDHYGLIDITGDNSGRQRKSNSIRTDIDIVEGLLQSKHITNRGVNEQHGNSRLAINYWLVHGKTYIYGDCMPLVNDLKSGEVDKNGGLNKDRNKGHSQDAGDAFRYGVHRWIGQRREDVENEIEVIRIHTGWKPGDGVPDIEDLRGGY